MKLIVVVIVSWLAGAAALAGSAAGASPVYSYDRCVSEAMGTFLSATASPAVRALISPAKVKVGVREFCRAAGNSGVYESRSEAELQRRLVTFMREDPQAIVGWCRPLAYAARGGLPTNVAREISAADWRRYAEGMCSVYGTYLRTDGSFDYRALARDHADAFAPFCAAGIEAASFDRSPSAWRASKARFRAAADAACVQLLRRGLMVYRGGGKFSLTRGAAYRAVIREFLGPLARN